MLRSLREFEAIRHDRTSLFLLLSLTGMLLVLILAGGSIIYLHRSASHRREMTRLNQTLADANQSLQELTLTDPLTTTITAIWLATRCSSRWARSCAVPPEAPTP